MQEDYDVQVVEWIVWCGVEWSGVKYVVYDVVFGVVWGSVWNGVEFSVL
jgi:hypothetical protein